MSRALLGLALLASCAEPDDRPETIQYATEAILAPSCGNGQCHSTFAREHDYVFDTVDGARRVMLDLVDTGYIEDADGISFHGIQKTLFLDVLTRFPDRMPYDQPLPDKDIAFLTRFVEAGVPGAQCFPGAGDTCVGAIIDNELAAGTLIVTCTDDWRYGDIIEDCRALAPTAVGRKWACSGGRPQCDDVVCGENDPDVRCEK